MSVSPLRSLCDALNGDPDRLALGTLDSGEWVWKLTRAEATAQIEAVAGQLLSMGIREGDVVAITMTNTIEFVISFLAANWMGAASMPLNSGYKTEEFKFYLDDVDAKVLLTAAEGNPEGEAAAAECGVPVSAVDKIDGSVTILGASGSLPNSYVANPHDISLILHTSGTTSAPKGVPLSHHNLVTSISNIRNTYELGPEDVSYLVMPLFHVHGLMSSLFAALSGGGSVCMPAQGKFSASSFWRDFVACGATWYSAVPTIHQFLLNGAEENFPSPPPKIRFIRSCSAALAPATMERIEAAFGAKVLEAYAMTEAAHQMCSNPLPKHGPRKPGTVGRATNVQLAILTDDGEEVPPGQGIVGEVCIRGENVAAGYHNRPDANESEYRFGWFHTGDQGVLDEDGYLSLVGRIKELINRGGEKISPLEVDAVLMACPGVGMAVCFAGPSENYGEEVFAAVVPKEGVTPVVTEGDVKAFVAERLAKEKVPTRVFISDDVPRTATGKIQRRIVAEAYIEEITQGQPKARL